MLVEKEVISPGTYWYTDEKTGLPRKLDVNPEMCKYWHKAGSDMLAAGLTIPVPFEHDFDAHPMTPAERLKNNAGWVKEYRMKQGDRLFSVLDIQDDEIAKKLPKTIRWTSPWINSFTDGAGRQWNNVISHLALTTRPRIAKQAPFPSFAAALSLASEVKVDTAAPTGEGFCLTRAGRIVRRKKTGRWQPQYPIAFSMISGGIRLAEDEKKTKMPPLTDEGEDDADNDGIPDEVDADPTDPTVGAGDMDMSGLMNPLQDSGGDVRMEELLCDLLQALGVPMPDESDEQQFKRHLYEAAMSKIKELTSKGMGGADAFKPDQNQPPNQQPNASQPQSNPLIQQEQQPMYMSLDQINTLPEPMKSVALAMYNENVRLRAEMDAAKKTTDSLRDAKLKEATAARNTRVQLLSRLSPRVKADLDAMVASPAMALSMGEGGTVVDPMAQTLAVLEKGLADMPRLLTADQSALSVQPHPTDADMLSAERADQIADDLARKMGCTPLPTAKQAS